jgi:hypothetical protein
MEIVRNPQTVVVVVFYCCAYRLELNLGSDWLSG